MATNLICQIKGHSAFDSKGKDTYLDRRPKRYSFPDTNQAFCWVCEEIVIWVDRHDRWKRLGEL